MSAKFSRVNHAKTSNAKTVFPPTGTPQRLILLGPLRMIRSQCVANSDILGPILVWLDEFMGPELQTPVYADSMLPDIVYAVTVPMDDEHWRDWNKVLAVFARAAAWYETLTSDDPLDQVTASHYTANLFVQGKPLEEILADLLEHYNLGARQSVRRG